jgi:NagD protein
MEKKSFIIDMDGVLVAGKKMIPGADEFIKKMKSKQIKFLVLTNNSIYTPVDLAHRLQTAGLDIEKNQIFTSAMATANFMKAQKKTGSAFVIGESGLNVAIHDAGYIMASDNVDFVVLGETFNYDFHQITKAIRLIHNGARFLATNPDPTGPTDVGIVPATGAMAALIEKASGKSPFYCGKPNPFMIRSALNFLGVHSESTTLIGDRMDTDILTGIQTGMETILVLSGVTSLKDISGYPYQPNQIVKSVAEIKI